MPNNNLKSIDAIYLASALLVLWLLLSGYFNSLQISLGVVSSLAAMMLTARLKILPDGRLLFGMLLRLPGYLPWFTWEVIKSNWDVSKLIWKRHIRIHPKIISVPASQTTELGLAIHANSITLTPGTLTLEAEIGSLKVHALTNEIAEDLTSSAMDRRVSKLEGSQ